MNADKISLISIKTYRNSKTYNKKYIKNYTNLLTFTPETYICSTKYIKTIQIYLRLLKKLTNVQLNT